METVYRQAFTEVLEVLKHTSKSIVEKIPENKCMCKEFRDQIADPNFEGYCHCRLYYKYK